jgi:16S rRNA C967 or C1407 C5-methylase (RsmB/RsmF family)/NOL1/NOP2/fmu family ribosome biogenesis protein
MIFPEAFRQRIKLQQYIDSEALLLALEEPSPVTIRINSNKWKSVPENGERVPWCHDGFYIEKRPPFTLDPLFHSGSYYPQEASSMFLEQVYNQTLGNRKNVRALDLCGAPGGKSTHLSTLIGQNGMLVANEVIRSRASILAENITKWGLSNTIVTLNDPSSFKMLPGFFDLILTDAPCSGEGMFRDRIAIREWSVENTALCAERQKRILMDVWPALKENGLLIYSTCTFNPGENEKNIKWLTGKHEAESVSLDIYNFAGITEIDYLGIKGYGFYPGKVRGEGLFISVLRKTGKQENNIPRNKVSGNFKVSGEEKAVAAEWTLFPSEALLKSGEKIYAFPGTYDDYLLLSNNLRVIKTGTKICTVKKKNYLPSHDIALSLFYRNDSFPVVNFDLNQALDFLSRKSIIVNDTPRGWIIATYEGVKLGFLNNIGSRTNNYYPVEWHIRMDVSKADREKLIRWNNGIFPDISPF